MLETPETFFRAMVVLEDNKEHDKVDVVIANRCETEQDAWNALDRFLEIMKHGKEFTIADYWVERVTIMRKRVELD